MKRYTHGILLAIVGLALIAAPLVAVVIIYGDQLVFKPSDFVNESFKFLIGIVAMLISFWISQVYWELKVDNERALRLRQLFLDYLNRTATTIVETSEALGPPLPSQEDTIRRDGEALANLRRLGDAEVGLRKLLDSYALESRLDERLGNAATYFRSKVAARLRRLSQYPQIRPLRDEIQKDLACVGKEIHRIVTYLGEEHNELDPAGR